VPRRIVRLVKRHGMDLEEPNTDDDAGDERQLEWPLYARIQGAAVVGRVVTGARSGARVTRIGQMRYPTEAKGNGPMHAHGEGFDLHAAVAVPAGDRSRLEHLCRYVLRPPLAQERLELTSDGKIVLRLRRPWQDGTRAICFEPLELLEKLAAMVPKPRINLLVYRGFRGSTRRCFGRLNNEPLQRCAQGNCNAGLGTTRARFRLACGSQLRLRWTLTGGLFTPYTVSREISQRPIPTRYAALPR